MNIKNVKKINELWKKINYKYFWGDFLDVRYYLCDQIAKLKNKKILDIGCGVGIITSLADESNKIIGIEIDKDAIDLARKINPKIEIIEEDFFTWNSSEKFDVIVLSHFLLSHLLNTDKKTGNIIKKVLSLLSDRGVVYITAPNMDYYYYKKMGGDFTISLFEIFKKNNLHVVFLHWNPLPIQLCHILKFFPQVFNTIEWIMKNNIFKKSVSLYFEVKK